MEQNIEFLHSNLDENAELSHKDEEVLENLELSPNISLDQSEELIEVKPEKNYFSTFYKQSGGLPDQSKRREVLLQDQKRRRNKLTDISRGILTENVDLGPTNSPKTHILRKVKKYKNKIMLSEWLIDVPEDLDVNWFLKVCPTGHRCLVVAYKHKTTSFSRKGEFEEEFYSVLPGGNMLENCNKGTILDCIWVPKKKVFHVLDVLVWSGQDLTDYNAEFRFFWLQSRMNETEELGLKTGNNKYPFIHVPHVSCEYSSILQAFETCSQYNNNIPVVDGALFYHREASYTSGRTPLVGWLKPFMIPEILNVPVASEYYNFRPAKYVNLKKHIEYGYNQRNKKVKNNKMEIEES